MDNDSYPAPDPVDIHLWFGLTYANYLVLHRSILQSMPEEWQHRFVACLQEMDAAMGEEMRERMPSNYHVRIPVREPEWVHPECDRCEGKGTEVIDDVLDDCPECKGSGKDYDASPEREDYDAIPTTSDPIPHYNRGRTVIDFATGREARYAG